MKGEGRAAGVEMGDGGWQSIISCPEFFFFYSFFFLQLIRRLPSTSTHNDFDMEKLAPPTSAGEIIAIISTCIKPAIIGKRLRTI